MTVRQQIVDMAIELLEKQPEGIRFMALKRALQDALPEIRATNIPATLVGLENHTNEVYKPVKGLFRLRKFKENDQAEIVPPIPILEKLKEAEFYEPFARWLVEELEECTKAIPLGGSKFKDKWGTPDVVGVLKPRPSDIISFPIEIVSAEIKVDTFGLITAFGQACSYKLFSHKSYIVVPVSSQPEDLQRLDSLCLIFGLGLITFNPQNSREPNFLIKTRASRHSPDMFYVNKHIREVADELL